jgi:hypothetical protein
VYCATGTFILTQALQTVLIRSLFFISERSLKLNAIMDLQGLKTSIFPAWYQLQVTEDGSPYIELPHRTTGESIFLTTLRLSDNVSMAAILNDPAYNDRLISLPKPYTVANADFWINLQLSSKSGLPLQAIRSGDPQNGAFVGAVSLLPRDAFSESPHQTSVAVEHELG